MTELLRYASECIVIAHGVATKGYGKSGDLTHVEDVGGPFRDLDRRTGSIAARAVGGTALGRQVGAGQRRLASTDANTDQRWASASIR